MIYTLSVDHMFYQQHIFINRRLLVDHTFIYVCNLKDVDFRNIIIKTFYDAVFQYYNYLKINETHDDDSKTIII